MQVKEWTRGDDMRLGDLVEPRYNSKYKIKPKKPRGVKTLNSSKFCMVCGLPKTEFEFVKHHITYDPELICYVHYDCHKKIHNGERPDLIQYTKAEREIFYGVKKLGL